MYTLAMNITLSIDEQIVERARKRAEAQGKSVEQVIRDYLRALGGDDPERSIQEFKRLSGRGRSRGWGFHREEIHQRS
jgi:ABC-type dipeptide/oligopeptide/nickel transport system ATPase component